MFVTNTTPYPHQLFFATDVAGTPHAVCILKASCPFDAPAWSRHHAEITYTDVPTDAARPSSIRLANDLAPYKPVADILLANAEAVSPKPKPAWGVSVRVGSHTTRVAVTGPRAWRRRVTGWVLDEPAHVSKVSVCFENAYGGTWSDGRCDDRNPVGTGFVPKGVDAQESIRAPQVLFETTLPESPFEPVRSAGLTPVAPAWTPRRQLAGTFDDSWRQTRWPRLPLDFDFAFYNVAQQHMQTSGFLKGDEAIELSGLSIAPINFSLPGCLKPAVMMRPRSDRGFLALMNLDTLVLHMGLRMAQCTFRACFIPPDGAEQAYIVANVAQEILHAAKPAGTPL